jgi:hypothetical protein
MQNVQPVADSAFVTIFDDTYNQPDCRGYIRMMDTLQYRNQHHAVAGFRAAVDELCRLRGLSQPHVIDFASSYGVVTALMKHDVTLGQIFRRYRENQFEAASSDDVISVDAAWYRERRRAGDNATFTAIDVAPNAISYGLATGLFDRGYVEDLQESRPSPELDSTLSTADMIVECGSVAQLMPTALDRLLQAAPARKPWVVTSPTRGNERAEAMEVMRDHGLVVEAMRVPPFVHRCFLNPDEQARGIEFARAAGHRTARREDTGCLYAQLYIARPREDCTPQECWRLSPVAEPMEGA